MKIRIENSNINEKISLKLSDLDVKGREILGLESKPEKFSLLENNIDYSFVETNKLITTDVRPEDHMVFINPGGGDREYPVDAPHWRTISKANIKASIQTPTGKDFFYTINTKGVGYLKPTLKGSNNLDAFDSWNRIDEYELEGAYGLADKGDFKNSDGRVMVKANYFLNNGLRTEAYLAIADLKNVIYKGKKTSIKELQETKVIPTRLNVKPQIAQRLLKTNTRIAELKESDSKRGIELLKNAYEVFNQETIDKRLDLLKLDFANPQSAVVYTREFSKRMGKNLAVLQNLGYIGWHLHSANITLAAEIVDIGPILPAEDYKDDQEFVKNYNGVMRGVLKDIRDVSYDLKFLLHSVEKLTGKNLDISELCQIYLDSFKDGLDQQQLKKNGGFKGEDIINMFEKISSAVLVEDRSLPSLKHGADISDWGLD